MFQRMRTGITDQLKHVLTRVGARLSNDRNQQLQALTNYVALGRWMADRGYDFAERVRGREGVFERIRDRIENQRVLYLEFGVYQGDSMRYWAEALKNPSAHLHGFDSFQGLPEVGGTWEKGAFDTEGTIPVVEDPRVQFFKG